MTTYISLYQDADGNSFVGEPWEVATPEDYREVLATEQVVLKDIPVVETISICEVRETLTRQDNE